MSSIESLPGYGIDVRTNGAQGDGASDDGPALQRALDRGGLVAVPYGIYKTGVPLRVKSGTHLRVHPRARVVLADGAGRSAGDFLLTNADKNRGNEDIRIEGGIWDGNNANNKRGPDAPGSYSGVMIDFFNVRGLVLRDMTLADPTSYFTRFSDVHRFVIEDINLRACRLSPNQDGVHVAGLCDDGTIRRIRGAGDSTPNDDVVALLSDDALTRAQNLGIRNGPIRRIHISDISADDCHSFVRMMSAEHPIEEVDVDGVYGGCQVCAVNMDASRKCMVPVFKPDDPRFARGAGMLREIRLSRFHVWRSANRNQNPLIDAITRVRNLRVENFLRDPVRDAAPGIPTLQVGLVSQTRALLEGLSELQLEELRTASTCRIDRAERMAGAEPGTCYRAAGTVEMQTTLTLPRGGFERLYLNGEDTADLSPATETA